MPDRGAKTRTPPRAKPGLPTVTVARFEAVAKLLERLYREKASVFTDAQARFLKGHRDATIRSLNADEAVQLAAGLAESLKRPDAVTLAAELQAGELRSWDHPDPREILLAAGAATAPAFLDAACQLTALLELPDVEFETAYDTDTLDEAVGEAVKLLRRLDIEEARSRASFALDHYAAKAGAPGKGFSVVWNLIQWALREATMETLSLSSVSSSLMSSPESTGGGSE